MNTDSMQNINDDRIGKWFIYDGGAEVVIGYMSGWFRLTTSFTMNTGKVVPELVKNKVYQVIDVSIRRPSYNSRPLYSDMRNINPLHESYEIFTVVNSAGEYIGVESKHFVSVYDRVEYDTSNVALLTARRY